MGDEAERRRGRSEGKMFPSMFGSSDSTALSTASWRSGPAEKGGGLGFRAARGGNLGLGVAEERRGFGLGVATLPFSVGLL